MAGLFVVPSAARSADVEVSLVAAGVEVVARNATLSEVIDRIATEAGAELEYQGTPPARVVTLRLTASTAAEALLRVLDGEGLDYALRLEPGGARVERLLVAASAPAGGGRPAPRRAAPPVAEAPASPSYPSLPPVLQDLLDSGALPSELETAEPEQAAPQPAPRARPGVPRPQPLLFPTPLPQPTPEPRSDR